MNSLERYLSVLRGNSADFLPRTPILMQFAAERIGSNYGCFASDYRVLVEANVRCAREFGIDQLSCISDPYRETQGFGASIEYVENGVPRSTHPLIESKDLSLLLRPDPFKSERMLDRVKAVQVYKERFAGEYSILGWVEGPAAEASTLRSPVRFLIDLLKDPVFAGELMDLCVDVGIAYARAQVTAGANTIGIGDAIASQVSPAVYEGLIQPREKRLIAAIKQMAAYVKLHICGNITHLLPGLADLDVDIIDVDHMVDISAVRAKVGTSVVITGNIDPVEGVYRGTPALIKDTILRIYDQVGNPYMVNAGCEIPSGTPVENLRALCDPIPCRP
ncbi:MAG TPA: uroporphyrinogen decarboxylase family protein [Phycisphaerae bacterium]|nr:uroporphyrinogen decarboxylase family protein [Phycisphaerae bacterium]